MRLRSDVNIPAFLQAVQACEGDVCFVTQDGDILNLKSVLSQFVFAAVIAGKLQSFDGFITVKIAADEIRLRDYLV